MKSMNWYQISGDFFYAVSESPHPVTLIMGLRVVFIPSKLGTLTLKVSWLTTVVTRFRRWIARVKCFLHLRLRCRLQFAPQDLPSLSIFILIFWWCFFPKSQIRYLVVTYLQRRPRNMVRIRSSSSKFFPAVEKSLFQYFYTICIS